MKLSVKESSKNYACTVVEVNDIFDIENADNIKRGVIFGNNVVVSKDVKAGDKMLYFVSGTKISADYCHKNNLYDKAEENYDTTKRGFISHRQKRIKAIKLRGIISDGMLMPVDSLLPFLEPSSIKSLKVGDEFTDINDNSLCEKYIIPVKNTQGQNRQKQSEKRSRLVEKQFYLHNDTENLRRNVEKISPDDIIGVHYKKHGTSVVIGNILTIRQLSWFEKLLKRFGVDIQETEYDIIYSSRKVIKNGYLQNQQTNSFYTTDIWGDIAKEVGHKIPKNYTLYGEILGFTADGAVIQKDYDYGCTGAQNKFYVYRMTIVNPDGQVIELTDKQVEEFCEKNGLLYKDTFNYYGYANDMYPDLDLQNHWHKNFLANLERDYNEKNCYMCANKVPEEGIIVRRENSEYYEAYKLKSKAFLLKESDLQEKEETNLEDNQDEC